MSNRTAAAAALLAVLTTAALAGCTGAEPPAAGPSVKPAVVETPAQPSAAPSPTVAAPTPTPTPEGCGKRAKISTIGVSEGDEEPVFTATWNGVELVDRGPREFAMGKVTRDAKGRVVYTVARGDASAAIAERLCTEIWSFEGYFGYSPTLYVGDVIKVPDGMEPNVGIPWKRPPMQY